MTTGCSTIVALEAPGAADNDVIRELLRQRLATATETRTLAEAAYRAGQCLVDQVHQAHAALLAAQLDLAVEKEQRIKIHQEMLQQAEAWSRTVAEQAKASEATAIDVLKAKSQVLESQIALEREKLAK